MSAYLETTIPILRLISESIRLCDFIEAGAFESPVQADSEMLLGKRKQIGHAALRGY